MTVLEREVWAAAARREDVADDGSVKSGTEAFLAQARGGL